MATCLLDYAFSTAPIPLQVNAPGATATSRVNLAVFNPTPGVLCSQILVAVPVGTGAADLFLEPPLTSVNTAKWAISSQDVVKGEELGLGEGTFATIVFQCRDQADYGVGYSLVLSVVGTVNSTVGEFTYMIQEWSGTSPDDLNPKVGTFPLSKQEAVFTLTNFTAVAVDKPTVPGTAFANGQPLRLAWESTGTWFELYAKGNPAPLHAGPETSYELPGGLSADTQFVLVASVTGDPSHDSPSPGYQSIYLYDALTLVVTDPDLTPRTVAAQNTITAGGALTAASATVTGALGAGSATVTGALNTGSATVTGALTTGSVTTGGLTANAPAKVASTLEVTGKATLADTSAATLAAGAVTTGRITITGPNDSLHVQGGELWVDTGNRNAAQVFNTAGLYPTGWFQNRSGRLDNKVTGVVGWVVNASDCGLYTNGRMIAAGGLAALTHLPTRTGHRVVTSPLAPEAEVQLTGSAHLANGRARVVFDEDVADLVCFSQHAPYRVLLTPTGRCAGLIVVAKAADHFIVEEAADGYSDASFDWMVVSRVRADGEPSVAMRLPAQLPEAQRPPAGGGESGGAADHGADGHGADDHGSSGAVDATAE
ncbi:hypothetical protein GCM10009839_54950 [Catenulispora yoronensis]|uniref:Uncharacterized protein n=1 Tax=Catenulispora yoronensis TaxID=450799 RepID=A0ABP5GDC9_9ACTN